VEQVEAAKSRVQARKTSKREKAADDPRAALTHDLLVYAEPKTKTKNAEVIQ
jgi:hypothetical protein